MKYIKQLSNEAEEFLAVLPKVLLLLRNKHKDVSFKENRQIIL